MKTYILCFLGLALQAQTTEVFLSISGVPSPGLTPPIEVTLPSGRKVSVADPASFRSAEPGLYRASAPAFRVPGRLVDSVLEAAPVSLTVKPGQKAAIAVSYARRGGSGMLWSATARLKDEDDFSKGSLRGLTEASLLASPSSPDASFTLGPRLTGGAVTANGSLLIGDGWDVNAILRFSPAALARGLRPTPVSGSTNVSLFPDGAGNIWTLSDRQLRRYPESAFLSSLPAKPAVDIELADEDEGLGSAGAVFTPAGDLLLYRNSLIARIPKARLNQSGPLSRADAAAIVTFDSGSVWQAALDPKGDLWITVSAGEVIQMPAAALASGGKVRGTRHAIPGEPRGLCIDNEGGVIVLTSNSGELFRRAPSGGAFTRLGSFGQGFDDFSRLTLNPAPEWSPLGRQPGSPRRLQ
jgi:hypothetical protein